MSHEVENMAYAGEVPWHGLGRKVHPDLTPEQMMESAGLNWTVEKRSFSVSIKSGGKTTSKVYPGKKAVIRMPRYKKGDVYMGEVMTKDDPIQEYGIVSDNWNVLQNAEAFGFFHDYVMAGGMKMHTAGSLRNGAIVWVLAEIGESFELFGGDKIDAYLMLSAHHTYGRAHQSAFTPIRVVCANTLRMAEGNNKGLVRWNHSRPFDPEKVKEKLGIAKHQLASYKEAAEFLGSKRYTPATSREFFLSLYKPTDRQLERDEIPAGAQTMMDVLDTQPGTQFAPGTWWQVFNAATFAIDHKIGSNEMKLNDNGEVKQTDGVRMDAAWFGGQAQKKLKALELATQFAKAA
jgi:phage/plasmid-like protein (TIGR03299 family)